MAILPVGTWGSQGNRNRQPMNYATGTPNDVGSGTGQPQAPAQPVVPQLNMGFGMPNSAYANARMRPGYGMPQGYVRGNMAPQPLPMRFQQGGMSPLANPLAGQMGYGQGSGGQNIQNFANRMGGWQGGMQGGFGFNPNMLVQMRRGVLPTTAPLGSNANPYRVSAY